jgi:hypothetical protein
MQIQGPRGPVTVHTSGVVVSCPLCRSHHWASGSGPIPGMYWNAERGLYCCRCPDDAEPIPTEDEC